MFNLIHYLISKLTLILCLNFEFLLVDLPLSVLQLFEGLILLQFFFFFQHFLILFPFKLSLQSTIRHIGLIHFFHQMFIMSLKKSLTSIIVFSNMILKLHGSFFIIVYISLSISSLNHGGSHISNYILVCGSLIFHSILIKKSIIFRDDFLFQFLFFMLLNCFLKLVMIQIFVCIHVVETWIFVNLNLIDHIFINLFSENLFVVFAGLKIEPISIFLLTHFLLLLQIRKSMQRQFVSMNLYNFQYNFYKFDFNNMGASCNSKPLPKTKPQKTGLQAAITKCKIHLQMKKNKINAEIINGQKQLVAKINGDPRSRIEQLLIAQRVVNGLKYTAVCTKLVQYSIHIKQRSNLICENIDHQDKLHPYIEEVYSMMYCGERMNITSLQQFRKYMEYIDQDLIVVQNTDQQIKKYLTPQPTPEQMNLYMIQMSERNNISLVKINQAGHSFSKKGGLTGSWDQTFKRESKRFRESLPRKDVIKANSQNHKKIFNTRKSIKNPFDSIEVELPQNHKQNEQKKDETDDISPQITQLMKQFKGS